MRSFALTYPQLMNQAIAAALDTEAVVRLRATYELAERFADGVYRPQGEPFLCHLVRTASIVLAEGQPLPVVQAALLHAAYSLRRRVGAGNEHGSRRAWLQKAASPEVEQLVFAYDQLPWNSSTQLKRHAEGFARYDQATRRVVLTTSSRITSIDRRPTLPPTWSVGGRNAATAALSWRERWPRPPSLVELSEVFDRQLDPPLPLAVVMGRNQGYTLQGKRWPELSRLREATRWLMRRMRDRSR
jgi:hypothetical protein